MMQISIALRNLLRNRRRSLTTLSAMVVGLVALLIFGGYARQVILGTQTGYVRYRGHLEIQRTGYFLYGSGNPIAYGISDYQRIIAAVRNDPVLQPMLVVVTPKLELTGIAGNSVNGASKGVFAMGIVVKDKIKMNKWDDYNLGTYTAPIALAGTSPDSVLIGTGLARILQMCAPLKLKDCPSAQETGAPDMTHDKGVAAPASIEALSALEQAGTHRAPATQIQLLAANERGAPNVADLNVARAENWGLKPLNDSLIMMHLRQAQRLVFGDARPQVTAIQIQLAHTAQIPAAKARIEHLLATQFKGKPLEVLNFKTLTPMYTQVIQFFNSMFGFISILIYVIVLFTVGTTMSTAVAERTTEIGTLRAIGQRRGGIRSLFVCEAALLGLVGAALGILVALPIAYLINHSGMTWEPPGYSYKYPIMVQVWGNPRLLFGTAFTLVIVAVSSAWWPASRASKLNIVDALRHV